MEPTIKALVEVLGLDEDEMRKLLDDDSTKSSQYQIVKKQISMDDKKAFESYENPGDAQRTDLPPRRKSVPRSQEYGLRRTI